MLAFPGGSPRIKFPPVWAASIPQRSPGAPGLLRNADCLVIDYSTDAEAAAALLP
jgi:hypothetical protein